MSVFKTSVCGLFSCVWTHTLSTPSQSLSIVWCRTLIRPEMVSIHVFNAFALSLDSAERLLLLILIFCGYDVLCKKSKFLRTQRISAGPDDGQTVRAKCVCSWKINELFWNCYWPSPRQPNFRFAQRFILFWITSIIAAVMFTFT